MLYALGSNSQGQLGNGSSNDCVHLTHLPRFFANETSAISNKINTENSPIKILSFSASENHSMCINSLYQLFATGCNQSYQTGCEISENLLSWTPVKLPAECIPVSVSCCSGCTIILDNQGTIWGCGSKDFGKLPNRADKKRKSRHYSKKIIKLDYKMLPNQYVSIYSGVHHVLAVDKSNQVWVWGKFKRKISKLQMDPQIIYKADPKNTISISAGQFFSIIVERQPDLTVFKTSLIGTLGKVSSLPTQILNAKKIPYFDCGWNHAVFSIENTSLVTIGKNCFCQLGSKEEDAHQFTITSHLPVSGIYCQAGSTLIVSKSKIYGWGWNEHCNLIPKPDVNIVSTPTFIADWNDDCDIFAGGAHFFYYCKGTVVESLSKSKDSDESSTTTTTTTTTSS